MSGRQAFYVGVKAIIQGDGGVLILKDNAHGKWELPGGRIDQNQTIEEALMRELKEEAGASFEKLGNVIHVGFGDNIVENGHKLFLVYFAVQAQLPADIPLSREHSQFAWAAKDNLDDFEMYRNEHIALTKYFKLDNR